MSRRVTKSRHRHKVTIDNAGDSDDSDAELSGENDDTNHAEAPSDSTYCEGS
jgi:hypothetical protein